MPDDQDIQVPPVKKDPFAFKPEYNNGHGQPKIDKQAAPKADPFAFKPEYNESVKKKDGTNVSGKESAPTPSPSSSEGVSSPVQSGPKMSDVVDKTYTLLNEGLPPSTDPKINGQRQQLLSSVKSGNQDAIKTAKDYIKTGLQKQIDKIKDDATSFTTPFGGTGTQKIYDPTPEQKDALEKLDAKMKQVDSTMDEYAINQAANSKEIQTQIRAEVSGKQRGNTPNIAAEDLGKQIEKIKGGLPNPNGNIQYERQKTGLETLINNKQLKINDLLTTFNKTGNQSMFEQANQEREEMNILKSRYQNLTDQFPDVAVTQVSRMIGDEISEFTTRQGIITKAAVEESANRIEAQHPGFIKKFGKYINVVESEPSLVPKGGFFGGLATGLNELQYGGAAFVAGIVGDTQTKEFAEKMEESPSLKATKQAHTNPTNVFYDDKGKAFKEKPDEDYGNINWNSSARFLGQSIPGLGEWITAEYATEGLIGLTGVGKAVDAAGKVIGKNAAAYGKLFGASVMTGYDENYKLVDPLIEDNSTTGQAKKAMTATLLTMATAGAFKLVGASPTNVAEKAVSKAIAPDIINALEENGYRQLPKNKLQDLMVNTVIPKVKTFAVEQAKAFGEGGKVAAAQVADQKVKDFVGQVLNPKKANASTLDENVKSFAQQTLFMGLLGLPKAVGAGFSSPSMKDAMYEIGSRAPMYVERVNEGLANGTYTQEEANKMIAMAKTMQEEVILAQYETTKDGKPLTVGQKKEIAVQNFRKRAAAGLAEAGAQVSPEKVNHDADDQIKDVKSQNTHLPLEETEAFKTAVEVDKEGNQVGKPTSVEEIDDKKKYRYSKNGREVTTTGLELQAHLPNSIEYEKSEAKIAADAKSEAEKAKAPEGKVSESKPTEEVSNAAKLVIGQIQDRSVETPYRDLLEKDPKQAEGIVKELADQINSGNESKLVDDGYSPETIAAIKEAYPKVELPELRTPEEVDKLLNKSIKGDKDQNRMIRDKGLDKKVNDLKDRHKLLESVLDCL